MTALITLNALFARLAARLALVARRRIDLPALDPTALFVPADLLGAPATDDALRGPRGTWIEGPFVRDAGTLQVRW